MGIKFMSRAQFCTLTDITIEQLNSLKRRAQLPAVPNQDLPKEVVDERGYEAGLALLLIIANELHDRYDISREYAALIAVRARDMYSRWDEIAKTSEQVIAGKEVDKEILFAALDLSGLNDPTRQTFAIGTLREIVRQHPKVRNVLAISLTRAAATMRRRAKKANIDLHPFWQTPT